MTCVVKPKIIHKKTMRYASEAMTPNRISSTQTKPTPPKLPLDVYEFPIEAGSAPLACGQPERS
jgi:hypothetical protein